MEGSRHAGQKRMHATAQEHKQSKKAAARMQWLSTRAIVLQRLIYTACTASASAQQRRSKFTKGCWDSAVGTAQTQTHAQRSKHTHDVFHHPRGLCRQEMLAGLLACHQTQSTSQHTSRSTTQQVPGFCRTTHVLEQLLTRRQSNPTPTHHPKRQGRSGRRGGCCHTGCGPAVQMHCIYAYGSLPMKALVPTPTCS